ncbi:MAG: DsbA family protein [Halioglobus sp.]
MADEFREQGGAATMDPSGFRRWITSKVLRSVVSPKRLASVESKAERVRSQSGSPHQIEYFHQVDDAYSHLAVQTLRQLGDRYQVELIVHLVEGPGGANLPEPDLLMPLARYDAALIAPHYGLEFPANAVAPSEDNCALAQRILTHAAGTGFADTALAVGQALFTGDDDALQTIAAQSGMAPAEEAIARVRAGTERRAQLKHYSGAMFYYGGVWYWGVDRLYHLEQRLSQLELSLQPQEAPLYPRPVIDSGSYRANGSLTLEFYASLRSPYTAVIFDEAVELAERSGVRLALKPVLPMVMRGVSLSRDKGLYIFRDATREARALGQTFGNFYDPIGGPARRCYALYPWAQRQGKHIALMSAFLKAAFREGTNTNSEHGFRSVVESAGLSWEESLREQESDEWQQLLEQNRQSMYQFGSWGVPTFRLLDSEGKQVMWAWGQDRLWLVAREIQRLLVQA